MEKRLIEAYDRMTMPDDCSRRIERMLQRQQKGAKGGRYTTMRAPSHRENWWGIAAALVCLILVISVGGTMLFLNASNNVTAVTPSAETGPVTETTGDDGMQEFMDGSIYIRYPDRWQLTEQQGEDGRRAYFVDPDMENTIVFSFDQGEASCVDLNRTAAEHQALLRESYPDAEVVEMTKTTIGGYDANKLVYTYTENGVSVTMTKYETVALWSSFGFCYYHPEQASEAYDATVDAVMASIRFYPTEAEQETEEDYYMAATSLPASVVEQFAVDVRNDILLRDWKTLSARIAYPITINETAIPDAAAFLELDIDGRLSAEFVKAIEEETCKRMFCNWQGVSMGNAGQIWLGSIDGELKVTALNDMLRTGSEENTEPVSGNYEYTENEDGTITLTKYTGSERNVVIPGQIDGKTVTTLGGHEAVDFGVFRNNATIESVFIPNTVTLIDDNTFSGCTNLETVTVSTSVKGIGHCAFDTCPNLKSLYFEGDAPATGNYLFDGTENVTIYYLSSASGWTNPWYGRTAKTYDGAGETKQTDSTAATVKFVDILAGSGRFYSHDYETELSIAEYCDTFGAGSGITVEVPKFTVVDMDGDGVNEVVLWLLVNGSNDYGTMVLHYQDGKVHGYTFYYRQLSELKVDGTFRWSGSASNNGIGVLKFDGTECSVEERQDNKQEFKDDVQWHVYPCQQVHGLLESYEHADAAKESAAKSTYYYYALAQDAARGYIGREKSSWDTLCTHLTEEGYVWSIGEEGCLVVYFPDIPGSWFYAWPAGIKDIGEICYYICTEDGEYEVKVTGLNTDSPRYYIDVDWMGEGTQVASATEVDAYIDAIDSIPKALESEQFVVTTLSEQFSSAYFTGDTRRMREMLADDFTGNVEVYGGSQDYVVTREICKVEEVMQVGDTLTTWFEFKESPSADSYTYLTMGLIKQEDDWKVRFYGLEK